MTGIELFEIRRTDVGLRQKMLIHYSAPKGFVGRNICYRIVSNAVCYGYIVGGSATRFLPGRNEFFGDEFSLNRVVNNIFFHSERVDGRYPCRWFVPRVLGEFRRRMTKDWKLKYSDDVIGFESLVELPRTGDCYKRDGWVAVGTTKGFTCKRVAGESTDSWSGKRQWNTKDLKPKLVFCIRCENK